MTCLTRPSALPSRHDVARAEAPGAPAATAAATIARPAHHLRIDIRTPVRSADAPEGNLSVGRRGRLPGEQQQLAGRAAGLEVVVRAARLSQPVATADA